MVNSRVSGFYSLTLSERRRRLAALLAWRPGEVEAFGVSGGLSAEGADAMVENALATFELPLGIALNFHINGHDHVIPMAVEEPSVIAAASHAALMAREAGGFTADADPGVMIGQIQLVDVPDPTGAEGRIAAARVRLIAAAAALTPGLCRRGVGPRDVEVRVLRTRNGEAIVVVHVLVDTGDAMGANAVNSLVEGLAPLVREIVGGSVCLRVLSNLADRRLARASVRVPFGALGSGDLGGAEVATRMMRAYEFAVVDPYRAATHNKGIMNGIDAVAVATGNDWRSIEAGAHAYAARAGSYGPLTAWRVADGCLLGSIELPLAVSTVGTTVEMHPRAKLALRVLGVTSGRQLAAVMAAVGLASNMAAMRALATDGIQKGHMALHARAVSYAAGARGEIADELRRRVLGLGDVKIRRARELLRTLGAPAVDPPPAIAKGAVE